MSLSSLHADIEPDIARAMRLARAVFDGDRAFEQELLVVLREIPHEGGLHALVAGLATVVAWFAKQVDRDNPAAPLDLVERAWAAVRAEMILDQVDDDDDSVTPAPY